MEHFGEAPRQPLEVQGVRPGAYGSLDRVFGDDSGECESQDVVRPAVQAPSLLPWIGSVKVGPTRSRSRVGASLNSIHNWFTP